MRLKLLKTFKRKAASPNDKTLPRLQYSHYGDKNLSFQVHDNHLNCKWIYTFDNMHEYQDCVRHWLDGATTYKRAPDYFIYEGSNKALHK